MRVIMDGHITPEAPLTVSPPGALASRGENIPGAAQMSGLPKMRLYQEEQGGFNFIPYCPASTIRGKIRRKARDVLSADLGEQWSLETHRILSVGGLQQSGESVKVDIEDYLSKLKSNPFLGLFGASVPDWVRGELSVAHAIPDTPHGFRPDVILGVRTDSIDRNPEETKMLTPDGLEKYRKIQRLFVEWDELAEKQKAAKSESDTEREEEIQQEINRLSAELKRLYGGTASEETGGKVTKERQISGYEAIPVGTPLKHRFILDNVDERQLGLFARTLEQFADSPYLGAKTAHGCGVVAGHWSVRITRDDGPVTGTCTLTPFSGVAFDGDVRSVIESALASWRDYVSGISVDDLESIKEFG